MCIALGVIKTGGHLDLGMESSLHDVVRDTTRPLRKLCQMSCAWKALSPVLCVPTTCTEWRRCMLACLAKLAVLQAPRLNPKRGVYTPSWTLRSYLFLVTRARGIERMVWGSIGIRSLGQMNPDQKQWFGCLEQHCKTTAALRKLIDDRCPPELLSCQLCMLSKPELDAYDAEWICSVGPLIRIVDRIGTHLRRGVPLPLLSVLKETAAATANL